MKLIQIKEKLGSGSTGKVYKITLEQAEEGDTEAESLVLEF